VFLAGKEGQVQKAQGEKEGDGEQQRHLFDLQVGLEGGREGGREGVSFFLVVWVRTRRRVMLNNSAISLISR